MKHFLPILVFPLMLLGASCTPEGTSFDNPQNGKQNGDQVQDEPQMLTVEEAEAQGRFVNTFYGYSLVFDEDKFENLQREILAPHAASLVVLENRETGQRLTIEVGDPEKVPNPLIQDQVTLPLRQFVDHLIETNTAENSFNPASKAVSEVEETSFAGYDAYLFTVTESFKSPRGERQLDERHIYYVFYNGEYNVIVWYPEAAADIQAIAQSWVPVAVER